MKTLKKFLIGTAVCLAGANVQAASVPVDLFNGIQEAIDNNSDDATPVTSSSAFDADILGGYRDLYANCVSGCGGAGGNASADIFVEDGALSFSTDSGVDGRGGVIWDGPGIGVGALGLGGPGAIDLTQGGSLNSFKLTTLSSDGTNNSGSTWTFAATAVDINGVFTTILFGATPVSPALGNSPHISYIPFSGFNACGASDPGIGLISVTCSPAPGVDLTQLVSLRVDFNVGGGIDIDLRLDSVEAIPEPSIMALLGTGLLSLGAMGARRKRKQSEA